MSTRAIHAQRETRRGYRCRCIRVDNDGAPIDFDRCPNETNADAPYCSQCEGAGHIESPCFGVVAL